MPQFSTDILFDSFCYLPRTSLDSTHISTRQFHAVTAQLHDQCLRGISAVSLTADQHNERLRVRCVQYGSRPKSHTDSSKQCARGRIFSGELEEVMTMLGVAIKSGSIRLLRIKGCQIDSEWICAFNHHLPTPEKSSVKKLLLERTILYDLSAVQFNQFVFR